MFEKVVYNKIHDFISDHNVLYDHQYNFRKGRSTQHAIITLFDRITKSQDMGDMVIAILIDLKKAFDTVDHKILHRKLYAYRIKGNMLNGLKAIYLTEHSMWYLMVKNLTPIVLNVAYPKDPFSVHFFYFIC